MQASVHLCCGRKHGYYVLEENGDKENRQCWFGHLSRRSNEVLSICSLCVETENVAII